MNSLEPKAYRLEPDRVFVGMSGGVDSSVSAALLKEQGHDVTGVFMKVWSPDWLPCPWPEERRDAMRVAAHLEIPFLTFDFTEEYKAHVVDYMIDEYRRGRVPNPDVMCNKFVKFDAFLRKSLAVGADRIATGHYSRVRQSTNHVQQSGAHLDTPCLSGRTRETCVIGLAPTHYQLLAGVDTNKDQSYFLWTLTQEQLSKTLFPVGHLLKSQVREEARRFNLPVAEKKDSQGVCFLGAIDMKEFLKHYIKEVPGEVLNESGEVIGHHEGVTFYTIGERRGFTITKKTPTDAPYYVIGKNIEANQLVVARRDRTEILVKELSSHLDAPRPSAGRSCVLEQVSWTGGVAPDPTKSYQARIRYRQPLQSCRLELTRSNASSEEQTCVVSFDAPQEAVAAGQSLVLYNGDECLGGGIIK